MRTGGYTIQQTLTAETASVLKHSLSLARRRGHAQVTPLHVAATLLSSRSSLLRRACIKSLPSFINNYRFATSHLPRALELCFNVALNRLPTIPNPISHGQPSLANALIAALKRAQAYQRRGCIEQQQQQQLGLTVKVELEQLVISILDDPGVSRVMREAGFSSTAVKNCIEDCSVSTVFYGSSLGVFSSPCSPYSKDQTLQRDFCQPVINPNIFWKTHFSNHSPEQNPLFVSPQKKVFTTDSSYYSVNEDINMVIEVLLRGKRRNPVIVSDSASLTKGLVSELVGKIEKGEIHGDLKQTHFIKFQFSQAAMKFLKREDVETNMSELKKKVDSVTSSGMSVIVYMGDLKWTVGENQNGDHQISSSCYSPLDYLVEEIAKLVFEYNKDDNNASNKSKVWVLGNASHQTYMRCQMKKPSLEIKWALQAVSVPSGGVGLSLNASSAREPKLNLSPNPAEVLETKPFAGKEDENALTCCAECMSNYEKEANTLESRKQNLLPFWLRPHGDNSSQKRELVSLRRKWNRFCVSPHHEKTNQSQFGSPLCTNQNLMEKSYSYALSSPWRPNQNSAFSESGSIVFMDSALMPNHRSCNAVAKFRRQNSCTIEFDLGNGCHKDKMGDPKLEYFKESEDNEAKITLGLGRSLFRWDSEKSHERKSEEKRQSSDLYKVLQENVPWQRETLPCIVETLMGSLSSKKDAWILIPGNDTAGKRRLARAIAESVFGSTDFLVQMNMSKRESEERTYSEILKNSLKTHEKLVVLVEDVDLADTQFLKLLADEFEDRNFGVKGKNDCQVIFILTKDDSWSKKDEGESQDSVIQSALNVKEANSDHKRKAECDLSSKAKKSKIDEQENACSGADEMVRIKKDFSRQSSFNGSLDLNLQADKDDEGEKPGEISPISSDLTLEISYNPQTSNGFLDLIKNRFVFDLNPNEDREMRDFF